MSELRLLCSNNAFMNIYYQIADHVISVKSDDKDVVAKVLPAFAPFYFEPDVRVTPLLELSYGHALSCEGTLMRTFDWEGTSCSMYQTGNGYFVELTDLRSGIKECMQSSNAWREVCVSVRPEEPHGGFFIDYFLMMAYSFASAPFNTLMMHASVIESNGKGMLFLGKSGTGKSTHSRLWLDHVADASLLNDDNPIVRIGSENEVRVYGSPWSGKTPCYRNKSLPVGAFVRLKQAPENRLHRLSPAQAFAALLPSCSNMIWDKGVHDAICTTIASLIPNSQVCLLECLPDQGAVKLSSSLI